MIEVWSGKVPELLTVKYGYPVCENPHFFFTIFLLYKCDSCFREIFIQVHWGESRLSDYFRIIAIVAKWYLVELSRNTFYLEREQLHCPAHCNDILMVRRLTRYQIPQTTKNCEDNLEKSSRASHSTPLRILNFSQEAYQKILQNLLYDVHSVRLRTTNMKIFSPWFLLSQCSPSRPVIWWNEIPFYFYSDIEYSYHFCSFARIVIKYSFSRSVAGAIHI